MEKNRRNEIEELVDEEFTEKDKKKVSKLLIIIIICLGIVILLLLFGLLFVPSIKLKGNKVVEISYNEKYNEAGVKAKYMFKDISKKVKITGTVDTSKIGTYEIKYSVKEGLINKTKVRKVNVVDKKAPIISLEGDTDVIICPNKKYKEAGFSAVDEYDGDLTDKVEINEQDKDITYTVSDKSGNKDTKVRNFERVDKENPVINLNGNSTTYVTINTKFSEPGYKATDNCDEDITDKVKTSGSVDTSKEGTYEIKYNVTDTAGNSVEAVRKVIVTQNIVRRSANMSCGEAGVIYLTFDDGPSGATTPTILNILKKYNVKATFFVTSSNGGSDDLIKRAYNEGHKIALHTYSHEYGQIYVSDEAFFNDLKKISDRVERVTGEKSMLTRFPGGSSNTVSRRYSTNIMSRLVNEVEAKGYTYFDWNVDSRDAEGKNADQIYSYTTSGLSKSHGNVVLMHDIKYTTMNALERVIQYGQNNGYTFKVLDSNVKCWHRVNN